MNIIVVGTAYPYRGGLAAFNECLSIQLQQDGHGVNIFTFNLQYPSFLFPGKTQYTDAPAPEGLCIDRKVNSCNPINWVSVGRQIAKKNPDLVIFAYWMSFMSPCFGTIARIIKRKKKICCIGLIHNMIPHETNILDKLLPKYYVQAMDGFVALSNSVVNDIMQFDKTKKPKRWSPHPMYSHYGNIISKDEARKQLGLDVVGKYVLFFGFIRDYKGLDLLIEAVSDMRLVNSGVKLLVAGEFYGNSQQYNSLIESLNLKDVVILRNDYIPDNEVNLYFCACDIVAQPYKTATQSGVTQVAFHFEKPMLVTNVGGLPEIVLVGKMGYVVDVSAKSIADALVCYFQEEREAEFTAGVREEKKKYSWQKMSETILNVYKACNGQS